jgi:predicted amidophosphoribosyltransferase
MNYFDQPERHRKKEPQPCDVCGKETTSRVAICSRLICEDCYFEHLFDMAVRDGEDNQP